MALTTSASTAWAALCWSEGVAWPSVCESVAEGLVVPGAAGRRLLREGWLTFFDAFPGFSALRTDMSDGIGLEDSMVDRAGSSGGLNPLSFSSSTTIEAADSSPNAIRLLLDKPPRVHAGMQPLDAENRTERYLTMWLDFAVCLDQTTSVPRFWPVRFGPAGRRGRCRVWVGDSADQ